MGSYIAKLEINGRLVVMDIDYYERTMSKLYEAKTILDGLEDVKSGNTVDGDTAISNIMYAQQFTLKKPALNRVRFCTLKSQ